MVLKNAEHLCQMLHMFRQGFTVNQDVVNKYHHTLPEHGMKDCVHKCLECCWGVCEPKWHHPELLVSMVSFECSFSFISRNDSNLVSLVKYAAPWSSSRSSSTIGKGYLSFTVMLFNYL